MSSEAVLVRSAWLEEFTRRFDMLLGEQAQAAPSAEQVALFPIGRGASYGLMLPDPATATGVQGFSLGARQG